MANVIENKQELQYVMQFYGLKQVPIIDENRDLGIVTSTMQYKGGSRVYKKEYEYLAFEKAIAKVNADMEQIKQWKNVSRQSFRTKLIYKSKESEHVERKYIWQSDISDSGVEVEQDDVDGAMVLVGNINVLRKFLSYANNHWRYCYDTKYLYDNEELVRLMQLFRDYDLYAAYDDFMEYYHNGIVD